MVAVVDAVLVDVLDIDVVVEVVDEAEVVEEVDEVEEVEVVEELGIIVFSIIPPELPPPPLLTVVVVDVEVVVEVVVVVIWAMIVIVPDLTLFVISGVVALSIITIFACKVLPVSAEGIVHAKEFVVPVIPVNSMFATSEPVTVFVIK